MNNKNIYYHEVKLVNPFQQQYYIYDDIGMHRVPYPWWFIFPYGQVFYPPRPRPIMPPHGPWMPPHHSWMPPQPREQ